MIWIVTKDTISSTEELHFRYQFIKQVTGAKVSPWVEYRWGRPFLRDTTYYKCQSDKGEYGIFITAHMNVGLRAILKIELGRKRAIAVINSCGITKKTITDCCSAIREKNKNSEIRFAKQAYSPEGFSINYVDKVGTFGFPTTISERELFQNRKKGLIKAIRQAFEKIDFAE